MPKGEAKKTSEKQKKRIFLSKNIHLNDTTYYDLL